MYNKNYKGDVCSHKHSFFLDNFIRRIFQNPKSIVGEYVKENDCVVDIGCGPGFFTIDMAKMVGNKGRVVAVDLQPEMLSKVEQKAKEKNLSQRINFHNCPQDKIGLPKDVKADFILAYYMVHETPSPENFFKEIKTLLKDNGKALIVEPTIHVSKKAFEKIQNDARKAGLKTIDRPAKKGGRSLLLSNAAKV
ncbi:MAG: class I SAM-dependent methyltransferase [Desulfobacteraceae bacterium]|nr:class I SAM-dependent methyltransferase [Desulfobacteraceae bacterium]